MSVAKYYPFNGERGRLRLGLEKINFSEWIQYEDQFPPRILQKQNLIQELGRNVLDALPCSIEAQIEFLDVLVNHIKHYHEDVFDVDGDCIIVKNGSIEYDIDTFESCPLELASYLAADDFCLLEKEGEDFKLIAASICAPTWWSLSEKIGKPLTSIHDPIMNLENKIGRMIRHFLNNLTVEDCYQRSNWFLFTSPELCVLPDSFDFCAEMKKINRKNIETNLFLRTERQTFRRLEKTNAIVFGIKVYVEPISIVKEYPAIAEDLLSAIKTMNADQKHGLGITFVEGALQDYLA